MSENETIEDILIKIDKLIEKRDRDLDAVDNLYADENGKILTIKYQDYEQRRDKTMQIFNRKFLDLTTKLDETCNQIRKKQPKLDELSKKTFRNLKRFPRKLVVGRRQVVYQNFDIIVPSSIEFPIKKAIYSKNLTTDMINCLILRLLYTSPINKIEFTIYDPDNLGGSVENFRKMFDFENIIPTKKVITQTKDIKQELEKAVTYCEKLIQKNLNRECDSWTEFNRIKYSQARQKDMLPYKVYIFFDLPIGFDTECMELVRKLIKNGEKLGVLVIFTFDEKSICNIDNFNKSMRDKLLEIIDSSLDIEEISQNIGENFKRLIVKNKKETLPLNMENMILDYIDLVMDNQKKSGLIETLLDSQNLYNMKSKDEIRIPLGLLNDGKSVDLAFGDQIPHAIIGGTTGSGKSNLLHNLILSACHRYSPYELNLYLMDFKEGVEFNVYDKLPQAKLVAVEADEEFGVSVLKHLVEEIQRRYKLFKKHNINSISQYRDIDEMPRILVVIDEFQELLNCSLKEKVHELFEKIVKQGRACGVHLIMATQTLNGLDFASLGTQFAGRIALKCSEEDSKKILGNLNNSKASEISIPYAILNSQSGIVEYNNKFVVAHAQQEKVKNAIKFLINNSRNYNIETKIFNGIKMPKHPETKIFFEENPKLKLGEIIDYNSSLLEITFEPRVNSNLMVICNKRVFTEGILTSVCKSGENCPNIDEIIYIGDRKNSNFSKVKTYMTVQEFLENVEHDIKNKFLIFDNVNPASEINYPAMIYAGLKLTEEQEKFDKLIKNCNKNGTHIIAVYDKISQIKSSTIFFEKFDYKIGVEMSDADINSFIGANFTNLSKTIKENRAFYSENGVILNWFKPFVGEEDE